MLYGEWKMEPVSYLKGPVQDLLVMCIICQTQKKGTLVNAGSNGLQTLQDSATKRHKLKDHKNKDVIDRIFNFTASESPTWHKSCYCAFTDKGKISRLEASGSKPKPRDSCPSSSGASKLRSSFEPLNWDLCLFCQVSSKETLHSICTFSMSQKVMEAAKYDQKLSIALSDCNDLMASKGKYHLKCYIQFQRNTMKNQNASKSLSLAKSWLKNELEQSANQGHILEVNGIWSRYCQLCSEANEEVRASYISRRASFCQQIETISWGNL